jgi:phenylalanyl-tRNA synthetase alpha chain
VEKIEQKIKKIEEEAKQQIQIINDLKQLEALRIKYLGRKGELTNILRSLKDLSLEQRKIIGPKAQQLKQKLDKLISLKKEDLEKRNLIPKIDLTKPGKKLKLGHLHPLTLVEQKMRQIFSGMNFSVVDGPELNKIFF